MTGRAGATSRTGESGAAGRLPGLSRVPASAGVTGAGRPAPERVPQAVPGAAEAAAGAWTAEQGVADDGL